MPTTGTTPLVAVANPPHLGRRTPTQTHARAAVRSGGIASVPRSGHAEGRTFDPAEIRQDVEGGLPTVGASVPTIHLGSEENPSIVRAWSACDRSTAHFTVP